MAFSSTPSKIDGLPPTFFFYTILRQQTTFLIGEWNLFASSAGSTTGGYDLLGNIKTKKTIKKRGLRGHSRGTAGGTGEGTLQGTRRGIGRRTGQWTGRGTAIHILRAAIHTRKFGTEILARRARISVPNFRRHLLRLIAA